MLIYCMEAFAWSKSDLTNESKTNYLHKLYLIYIINWRLFHVCISKCLSKNASATELWKAMNYLIANSQKAKQVTTDSQKAKQILF